MRDIRIDTLEDAVKKSNLDGATKDLLADQLHYAASINGSNNPILQGMKKLTIANVRQELSMHGVMAKMIKNHEERYHKAKPGNDSDTNPVTTWIRSNPILSTIVISAMCGIVIGRWGVSAALILLSQIFGLSVSPIG